MSKGRKIFLPLIFLLFVGYTIYSTLDLDQFTVRVCMRFEGRESCRTASGATRENALRTATDNACAQLTSGMSNTRRCSQQEPVSLEWLQE